MAIRGICLEYRRWARRRGLEGCSVLEILMFKNSFLSLKPNLGAYFGSDFLNYEGYDSCLHATQKRLLVRTTNVDIWCKNGGKLVKI